MIFHHVGCLVGDLEAAIESFKPVLAGPPGAAIAIARQGVTVSLLPLPGGAVLELVCPDEGSRGLQEMLRAGQSFYHIAFTVEDLDAQVELLSDQGYRLVTCFRSEAFEGALCAFLKVPTGELIELIQQSGPPSGIPSL
ncbi:VOC family protein [bacterium]|nr:VOC family protein [bacterium]